MATDHLPKSQTSTVSPPSHQQGGPGYPRIHPQGKEFRPGKKPLFLDRLGGRFLYISIAGHALFALVAVILVVQRIEAKRKLTFQSGQNGNPGAKAIEHKVQVTKKKNTMSAPAPSKRIAANTASARVAIPEMPMPTSNNVAPAGVIAGAGGAGPAFGAMPIATGGGGVGGGFLPFFGLRTAQVKGAFAGSIIDLKQTNEGKPSPLMGVAPADGSIAQVDRSQNNMYLLELRKILKSNYAPSAIGKYYRAPTQLYATQIFIPRMSSGEGPKGFEVADVIKPQRYLVHYTAKVNAPVSGRYHFVGLGDDVMVVKFNGKIVLDASLADATGFVAKRYLNYEPFGEPKDPTKMRSSNVAFSEGDAIEVAAGNSYPMEVTIGECPGGSFCGMLLLEKEGEDYKKDKRGNPILPIFKVAPSEVVVSKKSSVPVFAPDTNWSVWKAQPANATGTGLDFFKH